MLTQVESVDEYSPAFAAKSYTFPVDRLYPAGHIVGRVTASDEDAGILSLCLSLSLSLSLSVTLSLFFFLNREERNDCTGIRIYVG